MKTKPVVPRVIAEGDLERAFRYYLDTAGSKVAERFATEFEQILRLISRFPALGSPRYAFEHGLDEIRYWPLKKFPYMIFYQELDSHIDVWRVLHGHMDIAEQLRDLD